ncbi:MAG TPA: hypothetical protein DCQ83_01590 [Fibrobacteres bacterium]|jgi:ectoine hydroxylase-related dioxygenase (phytanoyl-CoA dioxygenase family)|nr:hypothetical protein [Fibrobacterota bacterium]
MTLQERLHRDGYLHVPGAVPQELFGEMLRAVQRLKEQYPYGFLTEDMYAGKTAIQRTVAPKPTDFTATMIYPNAGFLEPVLLAPLAWPWVHELVESVIGKDYYFSNTWMQGVSPGIGRMGFHKDPRGSLSFTLLLDDIGPGMGSTCLVPGSHLNTPPADFCMSDTQQPYPGEIELSGKAGDILFFSAETWHGRAVNASDKTTYRLFYNFYNRSSKNTTTWEKTASSDQVEKVKASLPSSLHRMFELDASFTDQLRAAAFNHIDARDGLRSFENVLADIRHSQRTYGKSVSHPKHSGHLLPYTTRLTENARFSTFKYLQHMRPLPTLKIMARKLLGR